MKPPANSSSTPAHVFTSYQKFVIAILAFLQFTIILDFMILSPLGAILLKELQVSTSAFGTVVSSYAIAAGISGILAAGFADRYDRKRLLLLFYSGFVLGTALCGFAPNYNVLLFARIITGLFGGVVGSVSLAIVADLFPIAVRGRVMGFIMSAFAASQVLGIPIGIYLANNLGWHAPFLMVAGVSFLVGIVIVYRLQPIDAHLKIVARRNAVQHLWETAKSSRYITGFLATMLLATGGFMLMPFGSTFTVNNLGISLERLPTLYMITGICSLVFGPLLGRLSDRVGKYRMFCIASLLGVAIIVYYTQLTSCSFWALVAISIIMFTTISGRMVSAGALTSAIPQPADRGAYMAISSSLQQFAGGVAAWIAGKIVIQSDAGPLLRYPLLGWVVSAAMIITIFLMYRVHQMVVSDAKKAAAVAGSPASIASTTTPSAEIDEVNLSSHS